MRIEAIRTVTVSKGDSARVASNYVFVVVETDQGIRGLGEGFHSLDEPIAASVGKFARSLIGEDPTAVTRNWQRIYRGLRYPLGTAELSALSAIEHALWDIAGKRLGVPVFRLLGGPTRDRIRLYSGLKSDDPDPAVAAAAVVARGFGALKFSPQPPNYGAMGDTEVIRGSVSRVRAVRERVGPDIDICLDYHGRSFSPVEAIRLAGELAPLGIYFLEEPALSDSPQSLLEAKTKTTIPIAAGERAVTRSNMRDLIELRAVHIIQPEPTANGGILETFKLAAMAEGAHIVVAPHQACSPVSLLVNAHVDAAIPNFLIQECNCFPYDEVARSILSPLPVIRDGFLELPEAPGIGIELDEQAAVEFPPRPYDRPIIVQADGSIGLE